MKNIDWAGIQADYVHICAFFDSREEEYDILGPFYKEAVEQGEKCLHIINPDKMDDHRAQLTAAGIDVEDCEACGKLELHSWHGTYLDEQGHFNRANMLAAVDGVCKAGVEAGFPRVRIMGNMDWVFEGAPGAEEILEFEAEVNEVLEHHRQAAVCVYDIAKLSGSMMMDLLRTHPLTIVNGVVQENPFYIPASQMLRELEARKSNSGVAADADTAGIS